MNSDLGQKRAVLDFGPHGQLQAQSVTLQQKLVQIQMQVYTKYKNKIMAKNTIQNWVKWVVDLSPNRAIGYYR